MGRRQHVRTGGVEPRMDGKGRLIYQPFSFDHLATVIYQKEILRGKAGEVAAKGVHQK